MTKTKKSAGSSGILSGFIPQKGDSTGELIRKIIFMLSLAVLIVMVVLIIRSKLTVQTVQREQESLASIYHSSDVQIDTQKREEIKKEFPEVQDKFIPLLDINKYTVGWITVGDFIDQPVLQCKNNDYFLDHDFNGNYSRSGAIFADFHVPITSESAPANTVLYGHNMLDYKTMFSRLIKYFNYGQKDVNDLSFYEQYPTVTYSTLYDTSTYKIFAGMMTNTEEIGGEVFNYHLVHNFASKAEFEDYWGKVLDRSTFYNPDVPIQYGDETLTLSTCIYGYNNAASTRFVLFARKVRDGESEKVDVSRAYANPDPLFYDLYYKVYGGEWGGRKWDTALMTGYEGKK